MIKRCAHCDREFEPDIYHPYQKYCSRRCRDRSKYLRDGEKIRARNRAYQRAHRDEINAWKRKCRRIGRSNHD